MVTRRQLLATTGLAGATTLLAGCSGGEQSPDSESTGSESTVSESSDTDEPEEQEILLNFSVGDISLSYGFSSGLSTTVELTNETEQGSGVNTANVAVEAYENKNLIGEDSQWQDIQATFTAEYALAIESVAQTADASLEDVTELRILGREENEEYGEIESLSGETVRSRVEE